MIDKDRMEKDTKQLLKFGHTANRPEPDAKVTTALTLPPVKVPEEMPSRSDEAIIERQVSITRVAAIAEIYKIEPSIENMIKVIEAVQQNVELSGGTTVQYKIHNNKLFKKELRRKIAHCYRQHLLSLDTRQVVML